ncbi:MAG TPA: hypothetical protein VNN20_02725 [Thermodesulfobacteriota bacterium]|nr:hypothetical protein [Thermodesulfobacteriota bacterium]
MLKACIEHVRKKGGKILEGYPIEPKEEKDLPAFAWTGLPAPSKAQVLWNAYAARKDAPIMRYYID